MLFLAAPFLLPPIPFSAVLSGLFLYDAAMLFLGIDLGASALKLIVIDAKGSPMAHIAAPIATLSPAVGTSATAEQDPNAWLITLETLLDNLFTNSAVKPEDITALSITAGTHIAVLCDRDMQPLRNAIMWSDQRAASIMPKLLAAQDKILAESLHAPNPTWTLAHLAWLTENDPDAISKTHMILPAKDWLRYCLTGHIGTDLSDAIGLQLVNAHKEEWSATLCDLSGVNASQLPEIAESKDYAGQISESAAQRFKLSPKTAVYTGAIDTSTELLRPSDYKSDAPASIKLASAGVVYMSVPDKTTLPPLSCYPHCTASDGWYLASGMNSCTTALDWLRKEVLSDISLQAFNECAAKAPAGAKGVVFHPYLMGERAPHWNPDLTASLSGMSRETDKSDIARAGFEGIAFAIRDIKENMEMLTGKTAETFKLLGGGAKSRLWSQIIADILQTPIHVQPNSDAAYGAGLLACLAHTGQMPSAAPNDAIMTFEPDTSLATFYAEKHAEFNLLRQKLS